MEDSTREDGTGLNDRIKFYYHPGGIKYHLVTSTSAYPSTVFQYPLFGGAGGNLVVPEVRFDSANLPFADTFPPLGLEENEKMEE